MCKCAYLHTYASVHTKHLLPAHIFQLVQCARTLRISCCVRRPRGRTQLHAVAERLSISFGDNNWVFSPVSQTPWLQPAIEAMCLWQKFVSSQCVRTAARAAPGCSQCTACLASLEPTMLAFPRLRSTIDDYCAFEPATALTVCQAYCTSWVEIFFLARNVCTTIFIPKLYLRYG